MYNVRTHRGYMGGWTNLQNPMRAQPMRQFRVCHRPDGIRTRENTVSLEVGMPHVDPSWTGQFEYPTSGIASADGTIPVNRFRLIVRPHRCTPRCKYGR